MSELIDRDALLSEIDAAFFKTNPTGEEQLGFIACRRIIRKAPAVDSVPRDEYDALLKRFRHLLESDFIRSFDEVDQKTGTYKRDILEADEPLKTHHSNLLCFKHSAGLAHGKKSEIHKYFILDAESLNSGLSNLSGRLGWSVYMDRRYEKSIDRMVQGWINFDRVLTGDEIVKYHLVSEPID